MITRFLGRLARDRSGNVAMMFALAIIPLILMIGMAIDLGNAMRIRIALQDATDSAVLAVARDGLRLTDAQIPPHAAAYISASYKYSNVPYTITKLTFDRATVTAELNASAKSPTTFMAIFGFNNIPVSTHAISKGLGFEIALVLDNSGSMLETAGAGGVKITALKEATKALFDTLFSKQVVSERFKISIVPFAASVNIGTNGVSAWLDNAAASPWNQDDFDTNLTRAGLYSALSNTTWKGCVMSRSGGMDVTDDPPSAGQASSLFVQWFAPDEPDTNLPNTTFPYPNSYIGDGGGTCKVKLNKLSDRERQELTCKYSGATPAAGKGPNYLCDSTPITRLTNSRATLDAAVTAMQAEGTTNILEGMMWGWRSISPAAPFTEGKAYGAPNNRKVIILMTDGYNNLSASPALGINMSLYGSYGMASHGRIGQVSSSNDTLTALLDAKTLQACTNAKNAGIVVYTIAFGADAAAAQNLLKSCATDPKFFYAPQNAADLKPVFIAIAESINSLRIAE